MASGDWALRKIDELKASSDNAIAIGPFGSRMKAELYMSTGVPVIRGNNISDTRALVGDFVFVSKETADQLKSSNVFAGDLVFPHRGAIGEVGIVPRDGTPRYLLSTSLMKLTCNEEVVDPVFLFYFFRSPTGRHELLKNTSTVGTPGIATPLTSLKSIEVTLPLFEEQRAIAHILGTLDDKIELNRRMNETLEAMSRAIFQSWFVDFDPVRAKANGEPAHSICRRLGLTLDLLALFPESCQDSELGEIPTGWATVLLGSLCSRVSMGPFGSDIKTDNFVEVGVPVVRGGNLTDGFVDEGFVFISEEKADQLRNANARSDDIVITHRGTLGQVGLIPKGSRYPRYVVSQSQMVLSINPNLSSPRYIFEFLRSPIGQHRLLANASQVGVPAIARPTTNVKSISIVAPCIELLRAFEMLVEPMLKRVVANTSESMTLAALRDTLLPKLISGDLRVKDAARFMAEAGA